MMKSTTSSLIGVLTSASCHYVAGYIFSTSSTEVKSTPSVPSCLANLDSGNIGNARVLNSETHDDMMSSTGLTPHGYALTVTLFSVAYTVFEIPSNWVMKHYIRPSIWLGSLLAAWGALTIGFTGVQNTATIVALRFLIGAFEAGFFPGASTYFTNHGCVLTIMPRHCLLHNDMVSLQRARRPNRLRRCFC